MKTSLYSLPNTNLATVLSIAILFAFIGIQSPGTAEAKAPVATKKAKATVKKSPKAKMMMLTVFLKHDQSKTLKQIGALLKKNKFWQHFPPKGVKVLSWHITMGIGHVIVLRLPPRLLRKVNIVIEKRAWGAFRTEFYPTYDFKPVWIKKYKPKK